MIRVLSVEKMWVSLANISGEHIFALFVFAGVMDTVIYVNSRNAGEYYWKFPFPAYGVFVNAATSTPLREVLKPTCVFYPVVADVNAVSICWMRF